MGLGLTGPGCNGLLSKRSCQGQLGGVRGADSCGDDGCKRGGRIFCVGDSWSLPIVDARTVTEGSDGKVHRA